MLDKKVYIVAVSGGVDSVVLLHKLMQKRSDKITYIVAHFDHGIRPDSRKDAKFVKQIAAKLQLEFELGEGNLGEEAGEALARDARYKFLRSVAIKHNADKIITAHHQDDLLETMIINIIRGTGPRGLSPMSGQSDLLRPLIHKTKNELVNYAHENKLYWVEDSTNNDENYLRNYVRKNIMPKLESSREQLLDINNHIDKTYHDIDMRFTHLLPKKNILYRPSFVQLPYLVQKEFIYQWLSKNSVNDITSDMVSRIVTSVKTLTIGKKSDINGLLWLVSEKENVLLTSKKHT